MISKEDMILFARKALGLSESVSIKLSPLEGRGSDRTFFRLRWNQPFDYPRSKTQGLLRVDTERRSLPRPEGSGLGPPKYQKDSAILIHYDPKRVENTFYADIAKFLHKINVPVPQVIHHDPANCLIITEDLGDTDLWSLRRDPWETRRTLYLKTLTVAHRLHSFREKDFPFGRVRLMESFDLNLYRWERDYFKDHFVRGVCGIELDPPFEQDLEAELSSLAERLLATIRSLVHRDLQSQNVMIRDGEPLLIDFQGMRLGNPFYDLGSLLCDPYVNLSDSERHELMSSCYEMGKWNLDWGTFQKSFWEASAQRLMQALGAYGFLGLKKGLKAYLVHIPSGLHHLRLATSNVPSLPRIRELSDECQKAIHAKDSDGGF